jgi:hypothetical protein
VLENFGFLDHYVQRTVADGWANQSDYLLLGSHQVAGMVVVGKHPACQAILLHYVVNRLAD